MYIISCGYRKSSCDRVPATESTRCLWVKAAYFCEDLSKQALHPIFLQFFFQISIPGNREPQDRCSEPHDWLGCKFGEKIDEKMDEVAIWINLISLLSKGDRMVSHSLSKYLLP